MENRVSKRGLAHAHILFWTDFDTQDIDTVDAMVNARYPKKSPFLMTKARCSIFAKRSTHIRHIIIPNVADFPVVNICSVILKEWPYIQEYVVTTIILPGMQKKEISCLIILRCLHPFELVIVSK
jgi:hypothetical protein